MSLKIIEKVYCIGDGDCRSIEESVVVDVGDGDVYGCDGGVVGGVGSF